MGTSSGELCKYSKFETYQELMGICRDFGEFMHINWKFVEIFIYKHKYKH